ncbi:ImmA/IrrE family metallo-endopeptidase [Actinomycetaceae bacterium L2_0104]
MRRGLSQAELAGILDVTERTIRKYETLGAPLVASGMLGEALDFPEDYFSRPTTVDMELAKVSFRAGRSTTRRQRESAKAAGHAAVEVRQWIAARFRLPGVDVPDLSGESPEVAADLLRSLWGLGTKPLPNLVQLCESRGVSVSGLPPVAASVDAYSAWDVGRPHIFVAQQKTPERARFDMAHELGHLILHKYRGDAPQPGEEDEANAFASEFLIPRDSLHEYLRMNPTFDELLKVKTAFAVSLFALVYAAHKKGRMSDWAYRMTCAELSERGFRNGEPGGMRSFEHSRIYSFVLSSEKGGRVTGERIGRELALPVEDVRAAMLNTELHSVKSKESGGLPTGDLAMDSLLRGRPADAPRNGLRLV